MCALAGVDLFDVAAEPEVVRAAVRGFDRAEAWCANPPEWLDPGSARRPELMVSITLSGDRHTQIAVVEMPVCISCDVCTDVCPPGSIVNGVVEDPICTGCGLCVAVCPPNCITLAPRETAPDVEACWEAGARALEIHTGAAAPEELANIRPLAANWQKRGGLLSYSIDGQQLGLGRAVALASELGERGVILQADGKPISGMEGDRSTIPALRLARAMLRRGTEAAVQVSGGANDRTGPLANRHGVAIAGVGMGSFARRHARPLDEKDDAQTWRRAVEGLSELVRSIQPEKAGVL
ncbi:MAG TPA: LdpA C-terminal domain-containing domain [Oscillatoriaceae cyanobacterium]